MESILNVLQEIVETSGFAALVSAGGWKNLIMIALACVLLYLGIGKKFEPLLLVGIAFGMLLTNQMCIRDSSMGTPCHLCYI